MKKKLQYELFYLFTYYIKEIHLLNIKEIDYSIFFIINCFE